ncbi:MAG: ribonuclease, partial [Patescibacteria group bacterium]|nr:ribonuclease [Patescibacteria group bacterium]
MQKNIAELAELIKVPYKADGHLEQAVVHRSYLNEHPDFPLAHNERLEFLGDAVLELVVTEYLYNNYPNPEGELTTWRSALVNGDSLSELAQKLGVEPYLYLSRGEEKDVNSKARRYILANAMEAIIGAVYL